MNFYEFMGNHIACAPRLAEVDHFETVFIQRKHKQFIDYIPTNKCVIQPCSILTGKSHSRLHSQF